jgi:diacylglycerol kinase family enzyme
VSTAPAPGELAPPAGPAAERNAVVVLNAHSGAGQGRELAERVERLFREAGFCPSVHLAEGPDAMRAAVRAARASGAAVIVAGGGDGTVSLVGAELAGSGLALGILPLGTLNHLARDLGIPLDPEAAIEVILAGHRTTIDAGELNGRLFLNNASLGLYPQIVRQRRRYSATGWRKWLVAILVTIKVLARYRAMAIRLEVDDAVILRRTPIVFVGNNEYRAAGLAAASRPSIAGGRLAIYIVNAGARHHPIRLLRLAWDMVLGRALDRDRLELVRARAATVDSKRSRLYVALDGEVDIFEVPLAFRILPQVLEVLTPLPSDPSPAAAPG